MDAHFDAAVDRPFFLQSHPLVVFDEAHSNYHTSTGRYEPLAKLLRSDGYRVVPGKSAFLREKLRGVSVLLIANARGEGSTVEKSAAAFTEDECEEVRAWVQSGGSLLLIADHTPFGGAAENLSRQFGVEMGNGYVFDLVNSTDDPTILVFSRNNNLLGDHEITRGRIPSESVGRVVAFTGQSLSVPFGGVALMKLAPTAYEAPSSENLNLAEKAARGVPMAANQALMYSKAVAGRAQAVALSFGKGRVVIMGEAAMLSAQILSGQVGQGDGRYGMNTPGNDNKRFALNIMHWLSGMERGK